MWTEQRGSTLSYELDQQLALRHLGPGWDQFALENGAPELVSPHPIGRPLWMFISGATTVHLYELLFDRVTRTRRPITVPTRCDGAARRRFLNLTVTPGSAGGFSITTLLLRSEPRQPILLFDRTTHRRTDSLDVCSWCSRLDVKGEWVEAEEAVAALRLFERDDMPRITQTVCGACERFMVTMLRDDSTALPS